MRSVLLCLCERETEAITLRKGGEKLVEGKREKQLCFNQEEDGSNNNNAAMRGKLTLLALTADLQN